MTEKQKEGLEWFKDQIKDLTPTKELDFWWLKEKNDSIFYYSKDKNLFFEYIPKFNYLHYDSDLWKRLERQYEFRRGRYDVSEDINNILKEFIGDENIKYFTIHMYDYKKIKEFIDGKSNQWRL